MTYVLLLLIIAGALGATALYSGRTAGRAAGQRVGVAAGFGALMGLATWPAAWLGGVGGAVPIVDRLLAAVVVAVALLIILGLVDLVVSRMGPARNASWLLTAIFAIVALVEASVIVSEGLVLWSLVDFGFVGLVAAIAWWAGLPPAAAADTAPPHG